jgi:two-component system, OmpR family, sensor histidine kinase KdpD
VSEKAGSFLQMIRRDRRGRLKVYLGYAAGVGKTFQMLQEGHRLKQEGIDVVVGVVETHGRKDTAGLIEGLEILPRRISEYHGIAVEEMDLAGILARKPQVVLVDELAHTNAPGSRNAKRYQDVEDLLAEGVHVLATLNVQHLESLYDMVEKSTGIKVRERVPDALLAEADQIVNIDVSVEDLHKRLKAGKVYPLDRVPTALNHFFKAQHLEMLRELTLREAASQIDARRREGEGKNLASATDQIMVCIDSRGAENAELLRFGSRLAGRLNRNWYAVYVQTLQENPVRIDAARQRHMAETLTLANQLGATVFTLKSDGIAETLARFAEEYHIGHMLLGKPRLKPLWKRIWIRLFAQENVIYDLLHRRLDCAITLVELRSRESVALDSSLSEPAKVPGKTGASSPSTSAEKLRLSDYLSERQIVIWREPVPKEKVLTDLVSVLATQNPAWKTDDLVSLLREREAQGSTFLNEGVALPHARVEGLASPLVALGLCHGGITDAGTENPIEIVFMLFSPKEQNRSHLQLLAFAGRMMQSRTLRLQLGDADSAKSALACIADFEAEA